MKGTSTSLLPQVQPTGKKDNSFFEQVYAVARQIPKGSVTSYGAIARCLGAARSARMVGWAMAVSGSAKPKVPAHRVVNTQGLLTGKFHFKAPDEMERLLLKENIEVKNNKVVNFKQKFWDPETAF